MTRYYYTILIICLLLSEVNGQNSKEEIEELKTKTLQEIDYANRILDETRGKKEASLNDLSVISHLLVKRQELLKELENEAHTISITVDANLKRIEFMQDQMGRIKEGYTKMLLNAYKNKRENYLFMYILAAENMNQAYKRLRYFRLYNDYQRRIIEELSELANELSISNEMLNQMYIMKSENISATARERSSISAEISEKSNIITLLEKRENELIREIEEKEKVSRRLEMELTAIIEEERKRANNALLLETLTPAERIISDEFGKNRGNLRWPTDQGIITGKYGEHDHPEYKSVKIRNDGIYISTIPGTEVKSIFRGTVSRVFTIPGENYSVIIQHGEYFTLYSNIINVRVTQGQEIETSQLIGNVFTDSNTRESILYFQVWKDIERNNPEEWLSH